MSDDLVKRLRDGCSCNIDSTPCMAEEECRDAYTAADRIEELDQACAKWAEVSQSNYQRAKAAEAKLAKAVEALTPSGDTKAEYAGEFHISVYDAEDEDGNEIWRKVPVDWTTIKAIMAAIKARATRAELKGQDDGQAPHAK